MGKKRKLKKQARKHGKAMAKKAALGAAAAKGLNDVKKSKRESKGGPAKKVVLTAGLLAGAYVAAKKLGLFNENGPKREAVPLLFEETDMP